MNKSFSSSKYILLSLLLAVFCYFIAPKISLPIADFISDLFIRFLKLLSLPVIFLSIFTTLINITNLEQARKALKKVLKYTILTTLISASIGLLLFVIIWPVNVLESSSNHIETPRNILNTYLSFVKNIIPSNPVEAFAEGNVLGIAFMACILGLATLFIKDKEKTSIKNFFNGLFKAILLISSIVIKILPLGVFAFSIQLIHQVASQKQNISALVGYAACVILANLIQGFVILPLFLKAKGLSPLKVAKAMLPALSLAFFSKSSSATLPLTIQSATKNLKVEENTASFSLPLCSVINMNGCAAFILVTVCFVTINSGVPMNIFNMLPWVVIASLMAIGNAGVPMGCYFLTSAALVGMNTPLTLLGMILPLYAFFDMVETALNVWSDSCVTTIVDKELKKDLTLNPDKTTLGA